jgi:hypothetical protein
MVAGIDDGDGRTRDAVRHVNDAIWEHHDMSPTDIRTRLLELAQERLAAEQAGLTADPA